MKDRSLEGRRQGCRPNHAGGAQEVPGGALPWEGWGGRESSSETPTVPFSKDGSRSGTVGGDGTAPPISGVGKAGRPRATPGREPSLLRSPKLTPDGLKTDAKM